MTFATQPNVSTNTNRMRGSTQFEHKGAAMPINKTTTIQARVSKQDKRFLREYADSQGITLSELLRRSTTALIQIIKAQQSNNLPRQ